MKNLLQTWWQSLESKTTLWLVIILLLGVGLRVNTLATKSKIPLETVRRHKIALDSIKYGDLSHCSKYFPYCEQGDSTASVGPVPILVFIAFFRLFSDNAAYILVLLQMALNLLTAVLLYKIITMMFANHRTALLASLLWGIYFPIIPMVELRLEAAPLFTFFVASGLLALQVGLSDHRIRYWILAGVFFGLASLSRVAFLYFTPMLAIFTVLLPSASAPVRKRILRSGILMAAFIIVLSPWVVRNALVFKAFIPGSTLTGYNLYRHNHLIIEDHRIPSKIALPVIFPSVFNEARRTNNDTVAFLYKNLNFSLPAYLSPVSRAQTRDNIYWLMEEPGILRGDENEFEMDRIYRQEALKLITAHPGRYLALSIYRFIPLWTNLLVEDSGISMLSWKFIGLVNISLLVLTATTLLRRRQKLFSPTLFPILLLLVYYNLGHMMINARVRFIIPLMPYIMALAADQMFYWATRIITVRSKSTPEFYPRLQTVKQQLK